MHAKALPRVDCYRHLLRFVDVMAARGRLVCRQIKMTFPEGKVTVDQRINCKEPLRTLRPVAFFASCRRPVM
jgi:hypothetical protein